ncbi:Glycosyltransferase 92 [Gracilaria domingensis]|nr:Glycosyltransferase 92 [Gracilaria domingensis]
MEDGSYVLPSDAFWEGQIDPPIQVDEGQYEVCLMTQEKSFADYLPEWVEYHRKLGVDHVFIYDNKAQVDISRKFKQRNDVEVVYWPWRRSQIQAQNHFIVNGWRRCKWAILIDVDEYVMTHSLDGPDHENALKSYLKSLREEHQYSQVRLSITTLGSSGHKLRPRMPIAEAYWHYANQQDNLTKPIVYLQHAVPDSNVHFVNLESTYHTLSKSREYHSKSGIEMELVHMKFRAWSDYLIKAHGGRNSMAVRTWDFTSNWTIDSRIPMQKHLQDLNSDSFIRFRAAWRRVVSRCTEEGKLVSFHR